MLASRLLEVCAGVSAERKSAIIRTVVLYVCGVLNSGAFKASLRDDTLWEPLQDFKINVLDLNGYILTKLWRAFLLLAAGWDPNYVQRVYNVSEDDLELLRGIDEDTLRQLRDKALEGIPDPTPGAIQENIYTRVRKMARHMVFNKLRFIAKYDPAIERDHSDFHAHIDMEVTRLLRRYDKMGSDPFTETLTTEKATSKVKLKRSPVVAVDSVTVDGEPWPFEIENFRTLIFPTVPKGATLHIEYTHFLKITNYIYQSITNVINGTISYHTAGCRRRCMNTGTRYQSTTESLLTDADTSLSVKGETRDVEGSDLMIKLRDCLTPRQLRMVNIITGNPVDGFDAWLTANGNNPSSDLSNSQLTAMGMRWLGMSRSELESIGEVLVNLSDRPTKLSDTQLRSYLESYLELDSLAELWNLPKQELEALREDVRKYGLNTLSLPTESLVRFLSFFDEMAVPTEQLQLDFSWKPNWEESGVRVGAGGDALISLSALDLEGAGALEHLNELPGVSQVRVGFSSCEVEAELEAVQLLGGLGDRELFGIEEPYEDDLWERVAVEPNLHIVRATAP